MKDLLLFLALSFAAPAFSQPTVFAPKGAVWHQTPWQAACYPFGLYTWTADEDTLVSGWNARAIHCNQVKLGNSTRIDSLTKYVSIQGDRVFWRANGQFVPLFDFGAMPGDTITSAVEGPHLLNTCFYNGVGGGIFRYRIDSVGTVNVSGQALRFQKTSAVGGSGWAASFTIVERIGSLESENWYGMGNGPCTLLGCPNFLRCYSDSEVQFTSPKWAWYNLPCDFVSTTKTGEAAAGTLKISPNPAADFVELPFVPDETRLANSLGRIAETHVLEERLDVSQLAPGVWFLMLKKGDRWSGFRLVKL